MKIPTLLLLFAAAPTAAAQSSAPVRFELPNGLRVWVQEDHRRPVALVHTAYKFGSINEGPGTTGAAHYIEHMVYRATENVRNEDQYGYNDRIGGRWTGGTGSLATTYGETVPSWALESALRVTAERMGGRALFEETEFNRERNNVVTEANGFSRTDPVSAFADAVKMASFDLHPYRYSSSTWARDNLDISRDDAYSLYKRYYGPNTAILTIAGDVTVAEVRRLVDKHFGALPRAPETGQVRLVEPPQRTEKRLTLSYAGERKQLDMIYRAPQAAHADYPVLAVFDRVLTARLQRPLSALGVTDLSTSHSATPYPNMYRFTASAASSVDLEAVVRTIQSEIDRMRTEDVTADDLAAARVDRPSGRGGRGGRGGQAQPAGGRQSLSQIASQLSGREVFPWEVSPELREGITRAQANVSAAQLKAFADRWLRTSQRTVGLLLPGGDNFMPAWSNGRPVVGERLEVPALTIPPAKRMVPDPVPARALEPLAALALETGRRVLPNGVIVRAVRVDGSRAALQIRVRTGNSGDPIGKEGLAALVARLIVGDSALQSFGARVSTSGLANDGYFDILDTVPAASLNAAVSAAARALRASSFTTSRIEAERARGLSTGGGRGGRGGGGGAAGGGGMNPATESRNRVLGAIAPAWRASDGATTASLARITAADVSDFLSRRLGAGGIVVGVAAPSSPESTMDFASRAFSAQRKVSAIAMPTQPVAQYETPITEVRIPLASETQVTVLGGVPGVPRYHPDYRALLLLNYISGAPFYGGRLGWALTKSGLTYSSTSITTGGATIGHITFSTECDTRNLESAIQAIREVVAGIGERGVEEWELREAKAWTLGRMLLGGPREDAGEDALAAALVDSETSGDEQLDLPAFSQRYLAVTLAEVNAAARKYYRSDLLKIVAIGAIPTGPKQMVFPAGTFRGLFEK